VKLTDEEKTKKRQEILASAREVFSKKSFHEANIEEIASRASISKGTLYIYFESKEDIFISMVIEEFRRWKVFLDDIASSNLPPDEKLKSLIREELNFHLQNEEFYSIYVSHRGSIKDIDDVLEKHKETFISEREQLLIVFTGIMQKLIETGFLKKQDPLDLSLILLGMIHGIIFKKLEGHELKKSEEIVKMIYDIFLDGVKGENRR